MKRLIVVILLFLVVVSCSDDESSPNPKPIFSITVDSDYPSLKKADFWIMIHDDEGQFLDAKQITGSGTFDFQTTKTISDKVGITLFSVENSTGSQAKYLSFRSFFSQSASQNVTLSWVKNSVSSVTANQIGNYTVNIKMPPVVRMDNLFNGSYYKNGDVLVFSSEIYDVGSNNVLISIADEKEPRYAWFDKVKDGDHFSIGFNEMKSFDYNLNLSFPSSRDPYVKVYGYDDNGFSYPVYVNSFQLAPFGDGYTISNLKIGYLNRLKKYSTFLQLSFSNYNFYYEKLGSPPASIAIPDHAAYKIQGRSLTNSSFTQENPYTFRESNYVNQSQSSQQISIYWTITDSGSNAKAASVKEISPDILKEYPFLRVNDFVHQSSYFNNSTFSYDDYVNLQIKNKELPSGNDRERIQVGVY